MLNTEVQGWIDFAASRVQTYGQPVAATVERDTPLFPTQEQMEQNPGHWLQYFSAYMSYYNTILFGYKSMFDILDNEYSTRFSKQVTEFPGTLGKAEHAARASLAALREARTIMDIQARRCYSNYKAAESYRDAASRIVTVLESERRIGLQ